MDDPRMGIAIQNVDAEYLKPVMGLLVYRYLLQSWIYPDVFFWDCNQWTPQ
jgi:hypothetical protein